MSPAEEITAICKEMGHGGQTRLARALGYAPRTIRRWIRGETSPRKPDLEIARKLANER